MDGYFKGKRVLCIAGSSLQLMALLCIVADTIDDSYECCDLVVYDTIPSGATLVERIREEKLFTRVLSPLKRYPESAHRGFQHLADTIFQTRPQDRLLSFCPELEGSEYDTLLTSWASGLALDAKLVCVRDGITVLFDDGLGSYTGDVFRWFACFDDVLPFGFFNGCALDRVKYCIKAISRFITRNSVCLGIKEVWLFSPAAKMWTAKNEIAIKEINYERAMKLIERVFLPPAPFRNRRMRHVSYPLFFTLPDYSPEDMRRIERSLIHELGQLSPNLAIRLHPLRHQESLFECRERITSNDCPWEVLLALDYLDEDATLISVGSSALYTPKILFGLEPKLVFLYKLVGMNTAQVKQFDEMVADLRRRYIDPNKVFVPSSSDELRSYAFH